MSQRKSYSDFGTRVRHGDEREGPWSLIAQRVIVAVVALFIPSCATEKEPEKQVLPAAARALAKEGYLGASSCQECHQEEQRLWAKTAHARAMTPATPEFVRGDFESDTTHTYDGQSYTMFRRGDNYYMRVPTVTGETTDALILYTLGARQHEMYLTRRPDGRIQVLPVYWDLIENRWYDAAEGTLEYGRALTPDDWLFWENPGRTWNHQCFDCHASQMRKNFDLEQNSYDTQLGDLSINCESCHGPGEDHVVFWRKALGDPELAARGENSLVRGTSLSPALQVEICAQCHAKKTILRSGYKPGDAFLDHYEINLIDDGESFWPDGLVRKLAYPYLQFAGSQCFQKADLTCTGCHANHGSDMPVELIADPAGGVLCGRCHPDVMVDISAHTFHKPAGKGSDCKACHMPEMFLSYLTVTDHRLTVPVPEVTSRLGVPNACNQAGCHSGETPEWSAGKAEAWWGDYQTERVNRVQAIAWGREGDARGLPELIRVVENPLEDPLLRGGAATLIGRIGEPSSLPTLLVALTDSHQVVRSRAALAAGKIGHPRAIPLLKELVKDPVYGVRVRSAFSLIKLEYVPPTEEDRVAFRDALTEHEESSLGILGDSPKTHVTIGQAHEGLLQFEAAILSYQRALRVSRLHEDAINRLRQLDEQQVKYEKLVKMVEPHLDKDIRLKVALGMAKIQRGMAREGVKLLRQVRGQDIESELVETGLGDAYRRAGDASSAVRHYNRAIEIFEKYPGAHRGLALVAYSRGDTEAGSKHWDLFKRYESTAGDSGSERMF